MQLVFESLRIYQLSVWKSLISMKKLATAQQTQPAKSQTNNLWSVNFWIDFLNLLVLLLSLQPFSWLCFHSTAENRK